MSPLARVDWPAVLVALLDQADDRTRDDAHFYASSDIDAMARRAAVFALLVCQESYPLLRGTVHANGADDLDVAQEVALWLKATAHVLLGGLSLAIAGGDQPEQPPASPGVLRIDPSLPDLPLVALAADLARLTGGISVVARALPPGVAGRYRRELQLVELDPAYPDVAGNWAHELGHALDPELGTRGAQELDEAFADHLGSLLLSYEPLTAAAAAPLVDQAGAATKACPRKRPPSAQLAPTPADLPAPGTESLVAFLTLPLLRPVPVGA